MWKVALASSLLATVSLPVTAQGRIVTFDVRDLLFQKAGAWPAMDQDSDLRMKRLGELSDAVVRREQKDASVTIEDQGYLMMRSAPDHVTRLSQLFRELRSGKVRSADLLISMIRMPVTLAAANGLQDGKSRDVTPEEMTQLLRKVQEAKGSLTNLPEVRMHTLQALDLPVPQRSLAPGAPPVQDLVARGQVLPIGDAAALHLEVREAPAKGSTGANAATEAKVVWSGVLAVGLGKGLLTTRVQDAEAHVMWVRLQAIGEPEALADIPVKTRK